MIDLWGIGIDVNEGKYIGNIDLRLTLLQILTIITLLWYKQTGFPFQIKGGVAHETYLSAECIVAQKDAWLPRKNEV